MAAVFANLIEGDRRRALAGALCGAGAILIGLPEFAIATRFIVPGVLLMVLEVAGIGLIIYGVQFLDPLVDDADPSSRSWPPLIAHIILAAVTAAILYDVIARPGAIYSEIWHNFPLLSLFALAGVLTILADIRPAGTVTMIVIAASLAPALVAEHSGWLIAQLVNPAAGSFETFDLERKIAEYWLPFFLVFPAAGFFAMLFGYLPRSVVIVAMLAILLYPPTRAPGMNYDYQEHSIPENWMVDYTIITQGYWYLTPDSRWTIGPAERRLVHLLYGEIAAGRINPSTHILHLAHDLLVYGPTSRFSMYTGIDDDTVTFEPTAEKWEAVLQGGRVRPVDRLAEALAVRPDYIVTQTAAPAGVKLPPAGYEKLLDQDGFILYRRIGLPASPPVRSVFPSWIDLIVAFLIGAAAAFAIRRLPAWPRRWPACH
jgi:hypothetical protein